MKTFKKPTAYVKILLKKWPLIATQETIEAVEKAKQRSAQKEYPYFQGRLLTSEEASKFMLKLDRILIVNYQKFGEKMWDHCKGKERKRIKKKCHYCHTDEYLVYTGEITNK